MDAAKLRHLAEVGLSGIDMTDTEDALEIAALCLAEILEHVADDPTSIALVARIEAGIGDKSRLGKQQPMHLSDCAIHCDRECDCGDLELAGDVSHRLVVSRVSPSRCLRLFIQNAGREYVIEPEQLPTDTLIALAAAWRDADATASTSKPA